MFLIAVLTVQKSLRELEILNCVHCLIFAEYLIVADAPDLHCKSIV